MTPTAGFHDEGHGFDLFGLAPGAVAKAAALGAPIYDHYFRVESLGVEQVPARGAAIVVANHSGVLPVDGTMVWLDLVRRTGRVPRLVADHFVPGLPFVSTLFARVGVVPGTRAHVRRLLERGELLVIFPEGVSGVAKRFRDRYRLQEWRVGHAELAIRHRAPVVPVAIVGAEESWPIAVRVRGVHAFGAPYLPIPVTPVPMPVRYHLRYGPPVTAHCQLPVEAADDPDAVAGAAATIRAALEHQIGLALAARRGWFR